MDDIDKNFINSYAEKIITAMRNRNMFGDRDDSKEFRILIQNSIITCVKHHKKRTTKKIKKEFDDGDD